MPKFRVTVQRLEYRSHDFEVEAKDKEEAYNKGIEESHDHDFNEDRCDTADENVTNVVEIK